MDQPAAPGHDSEDEHGRAQHGDHHGEAAEEPVVAPLAGGVPEALLEQRVQSR